jgi:hypothetical protein
VRRVAWLALLCLVPLAIGCSDGGPGPAADASLDAQRRLALTVAGPTTIRSLKVTITANGTTRNDTFVVGGLPATVDLPQPIQLGDWSIKVDGFDMNGVLVGRGMATVPSGTSETTVTLASI